MSAKLLTPPMSERPLRYEITILTGTKELVREDLVQMTMPKPRNARERGERAEMEAMVAPYGMKIHDAAEVEAPRRWWEFWR